MTLEKNDYIDTLDAVLAEIDKEKKEKKDKKISILKNQIKNNEFIIECALKKHFHEILSRKLPYCNTSTILAIPIEEAFELRTNISYELGNILTEYFRRDDKYAFIFGIKGINFFISSIVSFKIYKDAIPAEEDPDSMTYFPFIIPDHDLLEEINLEPELLKEIKAQGYRLQYLYKGVVINKYKLDKILDKSKYKDLIKRNVLF